MFDDSVFLNPPRSTIEMPDFLFEPAIFDDLSNEVKLMLWQRNRAVAEWNRRASLLKAMDNNLQGTARNKARRAIARINDWFERQRYNSNIDAVTGAAVTPLVDAARLKTLAEQNNQAVQAIAATAIAVDLFRIGTDLANIVNQNIGGPAGSG